MRHKLISPILALSALGDHVDGLEEVIRGAVEEFSGRTFEKIEHLWLRDAEGELQGIPADVGYDLYLEGTVNYVAEVNYLAKPGDVLSLHRKSAFAEKRLGKEIKPIRITMGITEAARKKCEALGVDLITRIVVS